MEVLEEFIRTGGAPNVSDAHTINGQPGDHYPCSKSERDKGEGFQIWVNCGTCFSRDKLGCTNHPIHLHGFSFYIVGLGFGNFDNDKDPLNYSLIDPPLRNTVTVPISGWAAIRFYADNPVLALPFGASPNLGNEFIVKDGKNKKERHGVKQPRYPWSDGPEYITQCPIQPGHKFKQKIIFSEEEGTIWWHAHSDWSRATVYGPIIVYPKRGASYPFPQPHEEVPIILGNSSS
ncbi:hypothetical protein ACE6H2_026360 [Prunus campanulata]